MAALAEPDSKREKNQAFTKLSNTLRFNGWLEGTPAPRAEYGL